MNNSVKKLPVDRTYFLRKEKGWGSKQKEPCVAIFCTHTFYRRGSQCSFLVLSVQ